MTSERHTLYIAGDFNIDLLKCDVHDETSNFLDVALEHHFVRWVQFAHFDFLHVSDSLHHDSHSSIKITVICQIIAEIFVVKHSCKCSFVEASRATTL